MNMKFWNLKDYETYLVAGVTQYMRVVIELFVWINKYTGG